MNDAEFEIRKAMFPVNGLMGNLKMAVREA
jgi:hypothetical protein